MIQFALIGCGRIADRHASQMARVGKLVAVCDVDKAKAEAIAATYGAHVYTNIDDLLAQEKEVAVVAVCTPNGLHAEHAIKSLQQGRHVLCEKPMCISTPAAYSMRDNAHFFRRHLYVVKSTRFNPLLVQVKTLLDEGRLGAVYSFQLSCFWNRPPAYYTDWHGTADMDGGTLYTQFSHYIDALIWLFGPLEEAKGFCSNAAHGASIAFEDTGTAALHFSKGVLGTINWSVNTFEKNSEIALTVIAEGGTISLGGEYLQKVKYQQFPEGLQLTEPQQTHPNDYATYKGTLSHHREVYDSLAAALTNPAHRLTNADDGLHTVAAIEKIYASVGAPLFLAP